MANGELCEAIKGRRLLRLRYDGFERVVEPHLVGRARAGGVILNAYQVRGGSVSGEEEGWKLFRLDGIEDPVVLDETFPGPRDGYVAHDRSVQEVYCRL